MGQVYLNNFRARLATTLAEGGTSAALQPGAALPTWGAGDWMYVTLTQAGTETAWEIIKATQWSTDSLDVVERAQQGTTAQNWPAWSKVQNRATAADYGGAASDPVGPTFQPQGGTTLSSGQYDNYTETDILSKGLLVFRANGDPSYLTGIDGAGRERGSLLLLEIRSDSTGSLILVNESPDSDPGNQFRLPNGLDYHMPYGRLVLVYTIGNGFGAWSGWMPLFATSTGFTLANAALIQPEPPGTVPYDLPIPPGTALAQMATVYGDATVEGVDSEGMVADEGTVLVFAQQGDGTYFASFIHESVLCQPQNQIVFRNGRTRTLRLGEQLALVYTNGRWRELAPWLSWGDIGGTVSDQDDLNTVLTGLQPFNENLEGLAAVPADDQTIPYFDTGQPQGMNVTGFTAAGRALLDDADAAAQRATLGLGSMAVEDAGSFDAAGAAAAAQAAAQAYADGLVVGLVDDRGNYDASGNVWPATGGSGTAGAILKGDLWTISVQGTLGGVVAYVGSSIRALTDTPGQTAANWATIQQDLGYVPVPTTRTVNGHALTGDVTVTPTDLALVIGTDTQAYSALLTAIAALNTSGAALKVLRRNAGNTDWELAAISATPRVTSAASSTTPTPNVDNEDVYKLTALAANAAFGAPTGTLTDGLKLEVWVRDDGAVRTFSWNAVYAAGGVALPAGTVPGKWLYLGFKYNSTAAKWHLVSASQEV